MEKVGSLRLFPTVIFMGLIVSRGACRWKRTRMSNHIRSWLQSVTKCSLIANGSCSSCCRMMVVSRKRTEPRHNLSVPTVQLCSRSVATIPLTLHSVVLSVVRMFKQVQEGVQAVSDASASSEAERVRKLRERVEAQEAKLRKLRALRGQVDQQRITNGSLCKKEEGRKKKKPLIVLLLCHVVTLFFFCFSEFSDLIAFAQLRTWRRSERSSTRRRRSWAWLPLRWRS